LKFCNGLTNSKINNIIEDKLNYWEKKKILEIERRENNSHHKSSEILKWERTSKKTYENMKEMIKKPMIGGKWF